MVMVYLTQARTHARTHAHTHTHKHTHACTHAHTHTHTHTHTYTYINTVYCIYTTVITVDGRIFHLRISSVEITFEIKMLAIKSSSFSVNYLNGP